MRWEVDGVGGGEWVFYGRGSIVWVVIVGA